MEGEKVMFDNNMKVEFISKSQNEGFARVAVAAFVSQLDPTLDELSDIKTAVSEAVTNSIIHGYSGRADGMISIESALKGSEIIIKITDYGKGIEDINKAREPLFTSRPDLERSGMGFTVMETFMDTVCVESELNNWTKVTMTKKIKSVI